MIHQSTNSDHAMDVIEFTTAEKNVKRNIGRWRVNGDTSRNVMLKKQNKNLSTFLYGIYKSN